MKHKKKGKNSIGTGLVLSFGLFGHYISSLLTTMGKEAKMAGLV